MNDALHRGELAALFLGEKVGEGTSRAVYLLAEPACIGRNLATFRIEAIPSLSKHVVKVEKGDGRFQNVSEWLLWDWVRTTKMEKWFAPCVSISPCGHYLVQQRVEPIRLGERPLRLPEFLVDLKRENFGMIDGRLVCCDYGTGLAAIRRTSRKLVKVDWSL